MWFPCAFHFVIAVYQLALSYFSDMFCTLGCNIDLFPDLTFINLKILPLYCDVVVPEFSGRLCYDERFIISRPL